jgi:tRNA threonylcarbamoyladenosine modification (KEOPS) complex  Pcc1 subunit
MAATYNPSLDQGATWEKVLTWKTGATPSPVNLTGYTARMTMKSNGADDFSLTTENGRIALGGTAGTVTLSISAADTATLSAQGYEYDLELVNGAYVKRLVEGVITVTRNVTT